MTANLLDDHFGKEEYPFPPENMFNFSHNQEKLAFVRTPNATTPLQTLEAP